jgi:hypothetical protein
MKAYKIVTVLLMGLGKYRECDKIFKECNRVKIVIKNDHYTNQKIT